MKYFASCLFAFRPSSLRAPIVSVLAMTAKGSVNALKDNATIRFKTKVTYFLNYLKTCCCSDSMAIFFKTH